MARRKEPSEYIASITVEDDGIRPVRDARPHSRDKLGILAMYIPPFAKACLRAGEFSFVDGLSGPGLYHFKDSDSYMLGSTTIASRLADPPFSKILAMDLSTKNVAALRQRTEDGGDRVRVRRGNVNRDLIPQMEGFIRPDKPILAFLDPEGIELEWQTVLKVASFRQKQKTELLVLVPTSSIGRVDAVSPDPVTTGARRLDFMFPGRTWQEVMERRANGELGPEQARAALADAYCEALRGQGYKSVRHRAITRGSAEAASVYHLVHATDSDPGERIMDHVFSAMYSNMRSTPALSETEVVTPRLTQLPLF